MSYLDVWKGPSLGSSLRGARWPLLGVTYLEAVLRTEVLEPRQLFFADAKAGLRGQQGGLMLKVGSCLILGKRGGRHHLPVGSRTIPLRLLRMFAVFSPNPLCEGSLKTCSSFLNPSYLTHPNTCVHDVTPTNPRALASITKCQYPKRAQPVHPVLGTRNSFCMHACSERDGHGIASRAMEVRA